MRSQIHSAPYAISLCIHFCADNECSGQGGNVLGNGTWLNVGGNQPVTYGGSNSDTGDTPPYYDPDGRNS